MEDKNKVFTADSNILAKLMGKFEDREQKGLVKYKKTMDRTDLTTLEWMTHLEEELMDALLYIGAAKREIQNLEEDNAHLEGEILELEELLAEAEEKKHFRIPGQEFRSPCTLHDEVSEEEVMAELERERRMRIIGQNGNDGLHYGKEEDGTGYVDYPENRRALYPGDVWVTTHTGPRPCGWDNTKKDGKV